MTLNEGGGSEQSSDLEGGTIDTFSSSEESEEKEEVLDSDDENGYTVDHFYVDFRHVFLQANLQNILGKPRYQLVNEQQSGNNQT